MTRQGDKRRLSASGYVGWWVLRGVARQIGFDTRSRALNAKALFRFWMVKKWRRLPKAVRGPLFAVGVSTRFLARSDRYLGAAVRSGAQRGVVEGRVRLGEREQLREHPRASEGRRHVQAVVREDRKRRREEHRRDGVVPPVSRTAQPGGVRKPGGVGVAAKPASKPPVGPARSKTVIPPPPQFPGQPVAGDWQVTYPGGRRSPVKGPGGYSREYAEQLATWARWRARLPGAGFGSDVRVTPRPERLDRFRGPDGELRFGSGPTDPNGVQGCDQCGGTASVHAAICSSCRARANIRAADHDRRQAPGGTAPAWVPQVGKAHNNGGPAMSASTGEVVTIDDLERAYAPLGPGVAAAQEQQHQAAADFRRQANEFEHAVGQLTADGHDAATIAEATATMEALQRLADQAEAIATAADEAMGTVTAGQEGLRRHDLIREAVGSHAGPADRTAAYAPS